MFLTTKKIYVVEKFKGHFALNLTITFINIQFLLYSIYIKDTLSAVYSLIGLFFSTLTCIGSLTYKPCKYSVSKINKRKLMISIPYVVFLYSIIFLLLRYYCESNKLLCIVLAFQFVRDIISHIASSMNVEFDYNSTR